MVMQAGEVAGLAQMRGGGCGRPRAATMEGEGGDRRDTEWPAWSLQEADSD